MTTILIHITPVNNRAQAGKPDQLTDITQAIAHDLRRFLLKEYPAGWIYDNNANGQDKPRRIEVTNDDKERTHRGSISSRPAQQPE